MSEHDTEKGENEKLTEGPISQHLLRLTGPMTVGVLAVMSVGVADAYFIGQIGEVELAAIGFIFPVTMALTSLGIGLSAGANALISQALGRNDDDAAKRYGAQAIALTVLLGTVVSGLGLALWRPLFSLLQAQEDVIPSIGNYMNVWFFSFPLLAMLLVSNSAIRAHGNTLLPSTVMVLNAVVNIGLNPLLIFGWGPIPPLGIAGAAAATLIAFAIASAAMCWPLFGVIRVTRMSDFVRSGYIETGQSLTRIGAPAALANAFNPAGLAVVTAIVSRFGPAAVAGFGVAGRIESLLLVPLLALSGSIGPVVGQNFGAGKIKRAARAVGLSVGFCTAYGLAVAVAITLVFEPVVALFSDSDKVQRATSLYLRIVSWSFFAYGIVIVVNAALNARSKAMVSMGLSVGRIALLYIPLALAGANWLGARGVYAGALLANLGAAAVAIVIAKRCDVFALPLR